MEKGVKLTPLLGKESETVLFQPTETVNVTLRAHDGEIFEISFT